MKFSLRRGLSRIYRGLARLGVDPLQTIQAVRGLSVVRSDRAQFQRQRVNSPYAGDFEVLEHFPIYADRHAQAGVAAGHYFHQDLFAAREIFLRNPVRHVDVGSSIYGFVSHVASFREVEVLDIRPLHSVVQGIRFVQCDVMNLPNSFIGYADSVSCLHALEHFGLGRYGDPIDYDGWRKGLNSLTRMLLPGGTLYFSVPTGEPQRVEFNAHRVFSLPFLRDTLVQKLSIEKLAFVTDSGELIPEVDPYSADATSSFGSRYGCSIWVLTKQ